jgi:hypothetical protein
VNVPNSLQEQVVEHERGQIMLLCSDGILTRWDVQKFSAVFKYDLSILAAVIYKDFGRKTDDMSVIAGRVNVMS